MALWVLRGGKHGEDVPRFLEQEIIFPRWGQSLRTDLKKIESKQAMSEAMRSAHPDRSKSNLASGVGQVWSFAKKMSPGDWVIVPHTSKAAVNVAELTGDCISDLGASELPIHYRQVKWVGTDIPRSNFDQDLLYSFGSTLTVFQVQRNDAEQRVRNMARNGWRASEAVPAIHVATDGDDADELQDLEQLARDQIAKLIIRKFKGHGLARLVEATLKAQGYTTYMSPAGPDKGIDILAAPGPIGFGKPRICVQVKSSDSPVDTPTLNQLIGSMQNVQADQGLLVSWGGFKSSVDREVPAQFFRVRLWDQDALINEMLGVYDKLDEDVRAEIPVKRIWTVTSQQEEDE